MIIIPKMSFTMNYIACCKQLVSTYPSFFFINTPSCCSLLYSFRLWIPSVSKVT